MPTNADTENRKKKNRKKEKKWNNIYVYKKTHISPSVSEFQIKIK